VAAADEPLAPPEAYRRYGPAMRRKAERILANREDAGDVVQALFVDLVERGVERVELAYLYRAVTNRCLNLIRDRRNRERLLERQEPALRGPARVRCDDQVIGLDLLMRLGGRLDDKHMEVLVCRYVDDMPQDEIALLCRTSRKTIGKRLQRIRERMAELRGEAEAPGDGPRSAGGGGEP
jgi:RNA polymerase sigma-70 factor (ECF subfamily)